MYTKNKITKFRHFALVSLVLMLVISITMIACDTSSDDDNDDDSSDVFTVSSSSFNNGATIPAKYRNTSLQGGPTAGVNTSPQISYDNPPTGTGSYIVLMYDDQAASWHHWLLYNITATTSIAESTGIIPANTTPITGGLGATGYYGPTPPEFPGGNHTYHFLVLALQESSITLNIADNARTTFSTNMSVLGTTIKTAATATTVNTAFSFDYNGTTYHVLDWNEHIGIANFTDF